MKNPWRSASNINPQLEDGHRRLNNEIWNALVEKLKSGPEFKITMFVIGKTFGFQKKEDIIAISQFARATGLTIRCIRENLKLLKHNKIIYYEPSKRMHRGSPLNAYLFNKHYDTWGEERVNGGVRVNRGVSKGAPPRKRRVNRGSATIDTTTKETITKNKPLVEKNLDHPRIIEYFTDKFRSASEGKKYYFKGSKDGPTIARMLKNYGYDTMVKMIDVFFESDDDFIKKAGYTIGVMSSQSNKLIQILNRPKANDYGKAGLL